MWTMAKDESEDPWVTYAWQYGDVSRRTCVHWVKDFETDADFSAG